MVRNVPSYQHHSLELKDYIEESNKDVTLEGFSLSLS